MGGYYQTMKGAGIGARRLALTRFREGTLLVAACTLALFALTPMPAHALSLDTAGDPFAAAPTVVRARVASVTCYRTARGELRTRVALDDVQALRGDANTELTIDLAGGTVGANTVQVSDTPAFLAGESVALALDDDGAPVGGLRSRLTIANERIIETGESVERFLGRMTASETPASVRRAFPETFGLLSSASVAEEPAATGVAAPSADAVTPAQAPAGTGDTVTITGTGFGATAGTVHFFYRDGQAEIVADADDIVSWSDTRVITRVPVGTIGGYAGASAGSGPLSVVTAAGLTSNALPFAVTYSLGPATWTAGTTSFAVLANCADTADELSLVRAGANAWAGASNFTVTYAGATSDPFPGNGMNEISWGALPEGTLGQASLSYYNSSMIEADIVLNDLYEWGDATAGADVDIPTVIAHELGHWLSLRDLYGANDAAKVMCGTLSFGQTRRTLTASDAAGIARLYGTLGNEAPVTTARVTPSAWTSGTATIALVAADASPGVSATYYRIGGGAPTLYQGPFEVAEEGRVRVAYWSVDGEQFAEDEKVVTARIDRSGPETTLTITPQADGTSHVTLATVDELSGVASVSYRLDGGAVVAGSAFDVVSNAAHTIEYWSVDNAGNREAARTETVPAVTLSAHFERISGPDRYQTAAAISRATFAAGSVERVVLATGATFADALAANGLAGALDSPVLLTSTTDLHPAVTGELARLGAERVTIVGGASAVSEQVASSLRGLGYDVDRIAGPDRYETAALVAKELAQVIGHEPELAFVVRGDAFADALAAAPFAYSQHAPILLSRPGDLPSATADILSGLGVHEVIVVGGTSAVDQAVVGGIEACDATTDRVAGTSRYATAAALLEYAIARGWTAPEAVGVATGTAFPDALGGGAAMGAMNGALVLTEPATLSSASATALGHCASTLDDVRVFGGDAAVAPAVVDSIVGALSR